MAENDPPVKFSAVIFDLGGVVVGSPLHAIAAYEREQGIPAGFINRVVVDTAPAGAWSRLERGELGLDAFFDAFEHDCRQAGQRICARTMMARMAAAAEPRPAMLTAVRRIRERGLKTAALTNNWETDREQEPASHALRPHFDVFVESSVVGLRKPDPRIYEHACAELGIPPGESVFLDDIGRNLKTARQLGMATVKVDDPEAALAELEGLLGFRVR
jgi:putative hydrolase of the HAD superfamily